MENCLLQTLQYLFLQVNLKSFHNVKPNVIPDRLTQKIKPNFPHCYYNISTIMFNATEWQKIVVHHTSYYNSIF